MFLELGKHWKMLRMADEFVGARSLEGLGASGRIGLEVFCLEGGGEVFPRILRFLLR